MFAIAPLPDTDGRYLDLSNDACSGTKDREIVVETDDRTRLLVAASSTGTGPEPTAVFVKEVCHVRACIAPRFCPGFSANKVFGLRRAAARELAEMLSVDIKARYLAIGTYVLVCQLFKHYKLFHNWLLVTV